MPIVNSVDKVAGRLRASLAAVLVFVSIVLSADAAILYKSYVIRQDRGVDVLCEPYIVEKHDYVIKLFKEKGEISEDDFPEFLNIFRRLNPNIRNINRILPGQHLLIPLKKLSQDALPGQDTGIVTIPFITLADVDKLLKDYSDAHVVRKGDTVSVLISRRFGSPGSQSYRDGIRLFRFMNPSVTDINHIYMGQKLLLPDSSVRKQSWFASLLDDTGKLTNQIAIDNLILSSRSATAIAQPSEETADTPVSGLEKAASLMDARVISRGTYYFPNKQGDDLKLDLMQHPVMELRDGRRILFAGEKPIRDLDLKTISAYWPNVSTATVPPKATYESILDAVGDAIRPGGLKNKLSLDDNGILIDIEARWIFEEGGSDRHPARYVCWMPRGGRDGRLPASIARYLKDQHIIVRELADEKAPAKSDSEKALRSPLPTHETILPVSNRRTFVQQLLSVLGYAYSPNGQITFPYAGVQVQAISNILLKPDGNPLLIDFGEFYGDTASALTESGFDILKIPESQPYPGIVQTLLEAIDVSFARSPTFDVSERAKGYRIRLTIPGIFIPGAQASKVFISERRLPEEILHFLEAKDITVLSIGS